MKLFKLSLCSKQILILGSVFCLAAEAYGFKGLVGKNCMKIFVVNIVAVAEACESCYPMIRDQMKITAGNGQDPKSNSRQYDKRNRIRSGATKSKRGIEYSDVRLLMIFAF